MSTTQTPHLGLIKPTPGTGEYADVSVINGNMDKLDAAIGEVDVTTDGSLQDQVTSIQESVNQNIIDITSLQNSETYSNYANQIHFDSYGKICVLTVNQYATFSNEYELITLPYTIPQDLTPRKTAFAPLTFNSSIAGGGFLKVDTDGMCYMQGWNAPKNASASGQIVWIAK